MFKGEKVILRSFKEADVERMHEFAQYSDLFAMDCAFPVGQTMQRLHGTYEFFTKESSAYAFFAIEADGKYIGDCGLMGMANPHGVGELGIVIGDRDYWGRGYGRDATRLLLHYGFHYRGLRRIVLTTHIKNQRAIRCYQACGFIEEGRQRKDVWLEGENVDLVKMSILREEWQAIAKA
ncbi:MAG: GNAT family N-acetyltransferase [Anaerolineae bacterium]|nr:GNAT family N-acetyltransferase [Anaerolineae bacterium]